MKSFSIAFAVVGLIAGLIAAGYWYQSTREELDTGIRKMDDGQNAFRLLAWVESVMNTFAKGSKLNAKAALWTAASVILGGISTLLSALSSN